MPTALKAPDAIASYIGGLARYCASEVCQHPQMVERLASNIAEHPDLWQLIVYYLTRLGVGPAYPHDTPVMVSLFDGATGEPIANPSPVEEAYAIVMGAQTCGDYDTAWATIGDIYAKYPDARVEVIGNAIIAAHSTLHG